MPSIEYMLHHPITICDAAEYIMSFILSLGITHISMGFAIAMTALYPSISSCIHGLFIMDIEMDRDNMSKRCNDG